MSRTKKVNPGRILFVGSGPGDPDLLTVRARNAIEKATTAYIDPDVPSGVVEMLGAAHRDEAAEQPRSGRGAKKTAPTKNGSAADENAKADDTTPAGDDAEAAEDSVVHPALGDPAEVAKTLVAAAKAGEDVVRVVSGDPLTTDSVLAEVNAVARTSVQFEVLPGLPAAAVVPSYAGMPLGSTHSEADVRAEGVDWAALAAAPGPLVQSRKEGRKI